jgi:RNase H-like domain found in reverse transcriptase/Reverse transcriptase (RNA-dependent DNA polymerase)
MESQDRLTFVSAVKVKKEVCTGEASSMVHVNAVEAGLPTTNKQVQMLNAGWQRLISKYQDVFPEEHPGMPLPRQVELKIVLEEGAKPVSKPVHKLYQAEQVELEAQIQLLLENGLIGPSMRSWGTPVLFSPKKDGGLRMCLDYRAQNKLTVKDKCPIPHVDELLDRLGGATHVSSIDLRSGYYQIRVREKDIPKTYIRTRYGSYEFIVMPFGLTYAPSTFQALINDVFRDYVDKFMLVYLDDVLIFSRSAEEHKERVELVLKRLRDEKLFAKLSPCEFNKPSVTFLGHVVGQEGLSMERKEVQCVLQWPRPTTKLQVPSILGFANYYRRFIKGFSQIAAPISNITRAKNAFWWSEKHDKSFAALKNAFTIAPVLKIPDSTKPYIVKIDASRSRIGALSGQEAEGGWHHVAFTSRKLQPAEENYPVHDLELMAIVYALHEWRVYLHGVDFDIETDHHLLRYLDIQPKLVVRNTQAYP